MRTVYRIDYTEHERGWGTSDGGYSLHLTQEEANNKVTEMLKGRDINDVPDFYISPCEPYPIEISEEGYNDLKNRQ